MLGSLALTVALLAAPPPPDRAYSGAEIPNRYHLPSDEWDPSLDYENMAKEVRADFLMVLAVALDPDRPRWREGDVFEELFGTRPR